MGAIVRRVGGSRRFRPRHFADKSADSVDGFTHSVALVGVEDGPATGGVESWKVTFLVGLDFVEEASGGGGLELGSS